MLQWCAERSARSDVGGVWFGADPPALLTAADVRDQRIDVFAQYSLLRLSAADTASAQDAREMLAAVRSGELGGIYKEDERVPALRAVQLGTWWGTIIPQGQNGALFLDPARPLDGVPLIVFRDDVRSNKPLIDAALRKAWAAFKALREAKRADPRVVQLNRCAARSPVAVAGVEIGQGSRTLGNVVPALCMQLANPQPPLSARELQLVDTSLERGAVGFESLTGDPERNADLLTNAIFCGRVLSSLLLSNTEDPLLCIDPEVTARDPRARQVRAAVVRARGPVIHFPAVPVNERLVRVMDALVAHGYSVNAAAGITGNLLAESGVLPSRVEGSAAASPLRTRDFAGRLTSFTAQQVMNRSVAGRVGPRLPGVGLAQWTTPARRAGLFAHSHLGRTLGAAILFNVEAQVDYLVTELGTIPGFNRLDAQLRAPAATVNGSSDDFVYQFEVPGSIIAGGRRLPRGDAAVQRVFAVRRANAQAALRAFQNRPAP